MRHLRKTWRQNPLIAERMASNGHKIMLSEADRLEYYHGAMSEKKVERLFRDHMLNRGTYILRKSNSEENALTISVVDNRTHIYHFRVNHLPDGKYAVGGSLYFNSIQQIIDHFRRKSVPGHENSSLLLGQPIRRKNITTKSTEKVASPEPHKAKIRTREQRPIADNWQFAERQEAADQQTVPIDRPPMPTPRIAEPIYNSEKHYYSDPEEVDHLDTVLERCKEADEYFEKKCKKCSCGLYMWESELVQGWMMHRDTEGPDAQGQIFFLDTRTNVSAWDLPPDIEAELRATDYSKWHNMKQLQDQANMIAAGR